jgi:hypothetical protein
MVWPVAKHALIMFTMIISGQHLRPPRRRDPSPKVLACAQKTTMEMALLKAVIAINVMTTAPLTLRHQQTP